MDAGGHAGQGADIAAMNAEGLTEVPLRHDIRSVTVPGCVDGWVQLHERFANLGCAAILAPAIRLAASGFPASPLLIASLGLLDDAARANGSTSWSGRRRRSAGAPSRCGAHPSCHRGRRS